jgi:cell division protein FtsI/penicillin-binding protein 2
MNSYVIKRWRKFGMVDPSENEIVCVTSIPIFLVKTYIRHLSLNFAKSVRKCFKTKVGAVAVLDAQTGEVFGKVSKPDFNLNDLSPRIPKEVFERITQKADG